MNQIKYKPKKKKCKNPYCGKDFLPYVPLQIVCSPVCALEYNSKKQVTKRVKEMKKALVTHQSSINLLQVLFNTWVRNRDAGKPCISCGQSLEGKKYDAGHLWPVKPYYGIRFDPDNVHAQCVHCNQHKDGNQAEYMIRLKERIGEQRVEELNKRRHQTFKISIPEIAELIMYYKQKINAYKNPSKD